MGGISLATLLILLATLSGCGGAVKSELRGFRVALLPPCVLRDFPDPGDVPMVALELFADRDPEINGKPTSPYNVAAELNLLTKTRPIRMIYLFPNDDVRYSSLIGTLDSIAALKLDRITLLTKSSGKDLANSYCQFNSSGLRPSN